jgi:hypothetical protein
MIVIFFLFKRIPHPPNSLQNRPAKFSIENFASLARIRKAQQEQHVL